MANSGMNPIIYAWKNTNFRRAFGRLLKCKAPDSIDPIQNSMRSNLHRKSSSLHHQDTINGSLPNYSTPPPLQKITSPVVAILPSNMHTVAHLTNSNENTNTHLPPQNVTLSSEQPQSDIKICVSNDNGNLSIVINDNYASTGYDFNNDNNDNESKSVSAENDDRKQTFDNDNVSDGGYDDYVLDDDNDYNNERGGTHTTTTPIFQDSNINNRRCILKSTSNSEIIPIPPPPISIKKSSSHNGKNNNIKSATNINNNNEITMTNIIINKCAIIENFENIKNSEHIPTGTKYNLSDTENGSSGTIKCLKTPNIIPSVMRENNHYQKPIGCIVNSSTNKNVQHEFIYKINLINEK